MTFQIVFCFSSDSPKFLHINLVPRVSYFEFLRETLLQCFMHCFLLRSVTDKTGNLAHNHRFLLQTMGKAADNTLEQRFLKEFKASGKNSSE